MKEKEKGHTVANGVRREVYPKPEHRLSNANIGMTFRESEPDFLPLDKASPRAPNVVVVLLDDVGYGSPSPYGGLVRMQPPGASRSKGSPTASSTLPRCAHRHGRAPTALCAPTRAALLTRRNHRTVSAGVVQEIATRFPGGSWSTATGRTTE